MSVQTVVVKPYRALDGIIADVTVEEDSEDELVVTEHPVEQGASIADHAFKRPAHLRLVYGWSLSNKRAGNDPQYLQTIYQKLLKLQVDRTRFEVFTGKRHYTNMLMLSVRVSTNKETENILLVHVHCQELLIATTQLVTVPDASLQKTPEDTAAVVPQGQQQLQPAPNFNASAIDLGGDVAA